MPSNPIWLLMTSSHIQILGVLCCFSSVPMCKPVTGLSSESVLFGMKMISIKIYRCAFTTKFITPVVLCQGIFKNQKLVRILNNFLSKRPENWGLVLNFSKGFSKSQQDILNSELTVSEKFVTRFYSISFFFNSCQSSIAIWAYLFISRGKNCKNFPKFHLWVWFF